MHESYDDLPNDETSAGGEIQGRETEPVDISEVSPESRHGSLEIGQQFGRYRIVRLLGSGGMGEVWEVEELESGRRIAIKTMNKSIGDESSRRRFLREGRLAAAISHPNSVYVYGTEEIDGTPVISMELIGGGTLQDLVNRDGPMDPPSAVDATLQLVDGLQAAAALGVLHRDIKPPNCFLSVDGVVKIGDYGLSLPVVRGDDTRLTVTHVLLGTPLFASPEQLQGEDLDVRSDIYSVGATLYYLLTGQAPLESNNLAKLLAAVARDTPPSPRQHREEIPRGLAKIVLRCLEKDPARRFANHAALMEALIPFGTPKLVPDSRLRWQAIALDWGIILGALVVGANAATLLPQVFGWLPGVWAPPYGLLWFAVILFAYFGVAELTGGASFGKRLLGLRVVRPDGTEPTRIQLLLRPIVIGALVGGGVLIDVGLLVLGYPWPPLLILGSCIAFFATSREANQFALLHDLLTGTRVLARQPRFMPTSSAPIERPLPGDSEPIGTIGDYSILRTLRDDDGGRLLVGFDPQLRRSVWIREARPGVAPVPERRQDVSRLGRIRWIDGKRSESANWDAYDAPAGMPFLQRTSSPQPWAAVRPWLVDIAEEITAAIDDGTLPPISLAHLWNTAEGRVKIIDFPVTAMETADPSAGEGFDGLSDKAGIAGFLDRIALSALLGRPVSATERAAEQLQSLDPQARAFLYTLRSGDHASPEEVCALARALVQTGTAVTWPRRLLTVAYFLFLGGAYALVPAVYAASSGGTVALQRWQESIINDLPVVAGLFAAPPVIWGPAFYALQLFIYAPIVLLVAFAGGSRSSPLFDAAGIEIITRDGAPASRLRVLRRAATAWSPVLVVGAPLTVAILMGLGSSYMHGAAWILTAATALMATGAVVSVLRPEQGLAERLTGTLLVPRLPLPDADRSLIDIILRRRR